MSPFVEHPIHGLLTSKINKNKILKQLTLSTNETYRLRLSQSSCFKPLYESSDNRLFS